MPPFQQISLSNFCPARAAPVNCKWKRLGAQQISNKVIRHKLTERDCWVLKLEARKNHLSSVATLSEFHMTSGSNVSKITVCWELHEMRFCGRAAAHKPKITMRNAKCRLAWCKARCHWTLEQWKHILWRDESAWHAQSEGHTEMVCRDRCGRT